jgi:diguanylate cyclase (GGDEF)-like protein
MTSLRRASFILSPILSLVLIAAVALYLAQTQATARDRQYRDFAQRATLTAGLTSSVLGFSSNPNKAYARGVFGGPADRVQAAVEADAKSDPHQLSVVFRADGLVLGAFPRSLRHEPRLLSVARNTQALRGGAMSLADSLPSRWGPVVMLNVPFATRYGPRVWAISVPVETVSSAVKGYLATSLGVTGGQAFLVDGRGVVLASSVNARLGALLPNRALLRRIRTPAGILANDRFVSAAIHHSSWRLLFTAPKRAVLGSLSSSDRTAWYLFGAFVAAVLCLLGSAAAALSRSSRLAHARLHDSLTGLPNRALFVEYVTRALLNLRRNGGHVGVLFIDLNLFKRINDLYGHAVGDALLVAVAERLITAVRSDDVVSRFGGDEFLVLHKDLTDEFEAHRIIERIYRSVSIPFQIAGRKVNIACSIGLAMHSDQAEPVDAFALIHQADVAMYQLKQMTRASVAPASAQPTDSVAWAAITPGACEHLTSPPPRG